MIDKRTAEELNRMLQMLQFMPTPENKRTGLLKVSPCCQGPSIEIFSTIQPVGYTGIHVCLICSSTFDPTFSGEP